MYASSPRPFGRAFGVVVALVGLWTGVAAAAFTTFESGQVRPLALSPDGSRLFAVNTPDDRLEIFDVDARRARRTPARSRSASSRSRSRRAPNAEVWVVNHLSDSVSIVDVATQPAARRRARCSSATSRATSSSPARAATARFITTAHRGQNCPRRRRSSPPPGIGARRRLGLRRRQPRRDARRHAAHASSTLFGDTPRALAVSARRQHGLRGGLPLRQPDDHACREGAGLQRRRRRRARAPSSGDDHAGRPAGARTRTVQGVAQPEAGLIVKFDTGASQWQRRARPQLEQRRALHPARPGRLRDRRERRPAGRRRPASPRVGTVLFNMAVNPVSGKVYVTQHRGAERGPLRGPRRLRRHAPCAATCTRRASPCSTARACCRAT